MSAITTGLLVAACGSAANSSVPKNSAPTQSAVGVPAESPPPEPTLDTSVAATPDPTTATIAERLPLGRPDFDSLDSPLRCTGDGGGLADGPIYATIEEFVGDARPEWDIAITQAVSVADGETLTYDFEVEAMPDADPAGLGFKSVDVEYRVLEVLSPDSAVQPGDSLRMALANERRDASDCTGDEPVVGSVEVHVFSRDLTTYDETSPQIEVDAVTLIRAGIGGGRINAFVPIMYRGQPWANFDRADADEFVEDLATALGQG